MPSNFFESKKIWPLAPNDPKVDVASQINANWDLIDSRIGWLLGRGGSVSLSAGLEYFASGFRYVVWDGSTVRLPDDIQSAWSNWTDFPVASGRVARSGFIPSWRNNSLLRKVECRGGFIYDAASNPWAAGLITLNADSAGSIPASMQPVGGVYSGPCAVGLTAGTSVVAGGYAYVDKPGANTFCRLRGQYMGGPGGGNFLMLDQIWWWY